MQAEAVKTRPPEPAALPGLNGASVDGVTLTGCFAGHCDWRLPTIVELRGIVDLTASACGSGSPCIDPVFGPTVAGIYWSATTFAFSPPNAWLVNFFVGIVGFDFKVFNDAVRAVRAGS